MMLAIALLLGSAVLIYLSCEYFVNSIEWVGRRLGIAQSAVGTVLAAFGTALPESVVTFVAVVFGADAAHREIGVGAALAGPLVLSTIAYAVVGLVFILQRKNSGNILLSASAAGRLSRDQSWFMGIFVLKVGLGLVAFAIKPWLGWLFLLAYGVYIWGEMRKEEEEDADAEINELEPLKFRPHDPLPGIGWALLQTVVALVVIFLSSQLFVHQLGEIAPWLGISPQLAALLLSPIATELPEILNAVIWVRQGKQTLALSNISGAMMIQATIPTALVLMFTPWMLNSALVWAAAVTMLSIAGLYGLLRRGMLSGGRLALFGLLYLAFALGLGLIGVR
ncbi:sodium:calcium antiporter [Paraherbaspirillum soli]|uniref:Sodium:calcium antiporter n=1 Tax=Paraherbaspirillum soli TaxID=631222 RepID=A0ABW0M8P8_9BURK